MEAADSNMSVRTTSVCWFINKKKARYFAISSPSRQVELTFDMISHSVQNFPAWFFEGCVIIKVDERPAEFFWLRFGILWMASISMIGVDLKTSECGFAQGRAHFRHDILFISKLFWLILGWICDHKGDERPADFLWLLFGIFLNGIEFYDRRGFEEMEMWICAWLDRQIFKKQICSIVPWLSVVRAYLAEFYEMQYTTFFALTSDVTKKASLSWWFCELHASIQEKTPNRCTQIDIELLESMPKSPKYECLTMRKLVAVSSKIPVSTFHIKKITWNAFFFFAPGFSVVRMTVHTHWQTE